jgi:RNA polymerase sigma factor (sigma-70 family)
MAATVSPGTEPRQKKDVPAEGWDSTTELVERARTGDRSAVNGLISRALPALKKFARGRIPAYGRGDADTEDVVQEAILNTLRRIKTFEYRDVGSLQAFLREVVVNRIRDIVRKVGRHGVAAEIPEHLPLNEPSPLEAAILSQRTARFTDAMTRLRRADRELIVWRVELGYSYGEISERLGAASPDAARMRVKRAIERLAELLDLDPSTLPDTPKRAPRKRGPAN